MDKPPKKHLGNDVYAEMFGPNVIILTKDSYDTYTEIILWEDAILGLKKFLETHKEQLPK